MLIKKIIVFIFLASSCIYGNNPMPEATTNENIYQFYQIFLSAYFIMMLVSMFKGYGVKRTMVIFRDYNDLGLTFLIAAAPILIYTLFTSFGGYPQLGALLAIAVSLILFVILVKNSYIDNNNSITYTSMAILTKIPLGVIWILNLISVLNPSGKTGRERRKNRGSALVFLTLLTPIISMLVVEKKGSFFNPIDWVKGRQIGNVRNHL